MLQLVLNNFSQQPDQPVLPQLRLMSTMFQGLFPAISVEKVGTRAAGKDLMC